MGGSQEYTYYARWWFQILFIFIPYLGKIPILTNIFQIGWNHQLVCVFKSLQYSYLYICVWVFVVCFVWSLMWGSRRPGHSSQAMSLIVTSCLGSCLYIWSGQIIATSAEVTPNGSLVRDSPNNALNSGLGIIVIWPDMMLLSNILLMEEILRSPVEVGSLPHYLQGFIHTRWCRFSSINSSNMF